MGLQPKLCPSRLHGSTSLSCFLFITFIVALIFYDDLEISLFSLLDTSLMTDPSFPRDRVYEKIIKPKLTFYSMLIRQRVEAGEGSERRREGEKDMEKWVGRLTGFSVQEGFIM